MVKDVIKFTDNAFKSKQKEIEGSGRTHDLRNALLGQWKVEDDSEEQNLVINEA